MSRETIQHFRPIPENALRELRDMHRPLCILSRATLEARLVNLESALRTAKEAMDERRGYAEAWEWKYGKAWDEEDAKVKAALGAA